MKVSCIREEKCCVFETTNSYLDFFLIGIHFIQDWIATTGYGVAKRGAKRLKCTGNLFRDNLQLIGVCLRKETVGIDILMTSRNGDRKIMQSIRITSRPSSRIRKWNYLSQFRWTFTNTFLWWAKGSREVKSEGPTVLDIHLL